MPGRNEPLAVNEFYHIYNRGVEKKNIFLQRRDYKRFLQTVYYYQFAGPKPKFSNFAKAQLGNFKPQQQQKLVEILCFCLMPNHFHFLVKQLKGNGTSFFLAQLCNSYTKYFNTKYDRVGPLLQGRFKAVRIGSDEQLIHLSRYIHINPLVSRIITNLDSYEWSSCNEYIANSSGFCSTEEILNLFRPRQEYKKFLESQADYGITLEVLKHCSIDDDI